MDESRILENVLKSQSKYDLVKKLPKNPIAYQSVGDVSPTRRVPWDEPSHCLLEKGRLRFLATFTLNLIEDSQLMKR